MFTETTIYYLVTAYKSADGRPYDMAKRRTRITAERLAASWAKKFFRVECEKVAADIDNENDIYGADLIAAYENGIKTTK